jgi:hypothetical protein
MAEDAPDSDTTAADQKAGGVKSLEKRVQELEKALGRPVASAKWYDRLEFSGVVEAEAGYNKVDFKDPGTADEKTSDVDLATVELGVDAKIVTHVDGHVLFKWEADELFVDESFIALSGTEAMPVYLVAGRQYIPFGNFESHFVSDPITLILGETNEGALVGGYRFNGNLVDFSFGAFNGKVKEIASDDQVYNYVAAVVVSPLENLVFGVSYTSNLAAADTLAEFFTDVDGNGANDDIARFVGGWSAFVSVSFLERFNLIGEYVGAAGAFRAGELYDAGNSQKRKPQAWNVELSFALTDTVEIAARYAGSDDGGDAVSGVFLLPEFQYGTVASWTVFDNTTLALEYLHGEFEEDVQKTDTVTAQLAIAF